MPGAAGFAASSKDQALVGTPTEHQSSKGVIGTSPRVDVLKINTYNLLQRKRLPVCSWELRHRNEHCDRWSCAACALRRARDFAERVLLLLDEAHALGLVAYFVRLSLPDGVPPAAGILRARFWRLCDAVKSSGAPWLAREASLGPGRPHLHVVAIGGPSVVELLALIESCHLRSSHEGVRLIPPTALDRFGVAEYTAGNGLRLVRQEIRAGRRPSEPYTRCRFQPLNM
jgi:hypothetical protein